ncbi:MAG: hypothetical protein K5854_04345 [Prevotella sp.]|nr:hypothetical protein [Prevotella sp.]
MKKIFPVIALVAAFSSVVSCSKLKGPDANEVAAQVCKTYYDSLIAGNVKFYIEGSNLPDSIPDGYREELETNMKMFLGQMEKEHGGLKAVRISDAHADTAKHTAQVFLVQIYGDSTREEVVVPMVQKNGNWYLK